MSGERVLEYLFEDTFTQFITGVMMFIAVSGVLTNTMILIIFLKIYGSKRLQGILWMNLSFCLLVQSFILIINALGNNYEFFSTSEVACRWKFTLPIVMDLVTMGCYSNLLIERILALHFPTFHSFTTKIDTVMILYGWCYGLAFMAAILTDVQPYQASTRCITPYINQTPQESVTFLTFWFIVFLLLVALVCLVFTDSLGLGKAENLRIQMEMKGASLVVTLGLLFVIVWLPKQIVSLLYWTDGVSTIKFQIASNLTAMLFRTHVVIPLLVLLSRAEFRFSFVSLLTCRTMDHIRRKVKNQESYIDTIQKMVIFERQSADKPSLSISYRSMMDRPPSEVAPTPSSAPPVELEPRKEVSISCICVQVIGHTTTP